MGENKMKDIKSTIIKSKIFPVIAGIFLWVLLLAAGCTAVENMGGDENYSGIAAETDSLTDTVISEVTESLSETAVPEAVMTETESPETAPPEITASETEAPETTVQTTVSSDSVSSDAEAVTSALISDVSASSEETVQTALSETVISETVAETAAESTISETAAEETSAAVDAGGSYYPQNNYYTLNFDRQKAVWFSYIEYERIMQGASEEQFTESLGECFDNILSIGCNTVYFQVRAYGDAYYESAIFPKGDRLTGDYDPLAIAVKAAHDRGLSIHAWINPMRLMTDAEMTELPSGYRISDWYRNDETNGTYIVNYSGRWYLSPAYYDAVSLICDGITEIVTGYNVDGVQIDDYFYPTDDPSFDEYAFNASGTSLSLADWRRQNVSIMVKRMYNAVHNANSSAVFGISPQGNVRSDYETLFADVYLWASEPGYCDYICPQIYYGFENGSLPFTETVESWRSMVTYPGISLVIGLAAYKIGIEDTWAGSGKYEWQENSDILARQIETAESVGAGYALFRYDSLFAPESGVSEKVNRELENIRS